MSSQPRRRQAALLANNKVQLQLSQNILQCKMWSPTLNKLKLRQPHLLQCTTECRMTPPLSFRSPWQCIVYLTVTTMQPMVT